MTKARDLADLISAGNPLADGAISVSEISDLTATAAEINQLDNTADLPDIRPSLLLDFANSKTLDPRITFTRGSTATYWDGKTTAKAEENLLRYSQILEGFSSNGNWSSTDSNITVNDAIAPDGTTTATKLQGDGASAEHRIITAGNNNTAVSSCTGQFAFSIFAKAGTNNYIQIRTNQSDSGYANFDISSGTAHPTTASASITDVGSGWYRCEVIFADSATTPLNISVHLVTGTSASRAEVNTLSTYVHLWGAQLEDRTSVTAYTATTTSPIVKYQPVLQTAASGEARFDHDPVTGESKGLLIEEARTNINTTSEHVGAGYNTTTNASALENYGIAPDGMQTADLLVENTATAFHQIVQAYAGPTSGETWTYSVFVKRGNGSRHFALRLRDSSGTILVDDNNAIVYFDLSTGTVSSSSDVGNVTLVGSSIEDAGNGWYRCSISGYISNLVSSYMVNNFMTTSAGSGESYAGDGFSSMLIWGMQMEEGSFPTSYIPTSGSTVTRAVEQVTMSNIASELNGQEGTLYVEATPPDYNLGDQRLVSIGSSHSNVVEMFREYGSTNFFFAIRHAGTTISQGSTAWAADTTAKAVIGYKSGDIGFAADGSLIMTNTGTFAGMEMNQMLIGRTFQGGASAWSGEIKKIAYYPQKFTNATLQAMTEE